MFRTPIVRPVRAGLHLPRLHLPRLLLPGLHLPRLHLPRLLLSGLLMAGLLFQGELARAASGDLIELIPFPGSTAQGITRDGADGTYWTPSLLGEVIHHYNPDGTAIGTIPSPFGAGGRPTGIAWYPQNDTLLVVDGFTHRLVEIDRTGALVGIDIVLPIAPVPNFGGPVLRGMAVHEAGGNNAIGSLYVVESVGPRIYEFDLGSGTEIRAFEHPQDPDGFPGGGLSAPSGGIEVLTDGQGALTGFDLVGGDGSQPLVLRLLPDGSATGFEIPLASIGAGNSGIPGIIRTVVIDPISNLPIDALVGVSETLNAVFAIDGSLPPIAQIADLTCDSTGDTVSLAWTPGPGYDAVEVERDGVIIATLPGDAAAYVDPALADGVYEYTVRGTLSALTTDPVTCVGVIGAGQILDQIELVGDPQFALDISFGDGLLYLTTSNGTIQSYTLGLFFNEEIPGPFNGPDDALSAIAYRSDTGTLLVVNAFDQTMQEIDIFGTPIGAPVVLAIDVPDDDPPYLGAMTYDPTGNNGSPQLWAVESTRSIVYRLALDGSVLDTSLHPDEVFEPTPDPSFIDTLALGIAGVPEIGSGFDQLDLAGGTVFDRRMRRIVRVDAATGTPTGPQTPLDATLQENNTRYYAIENATYLGEPVTYALDLRSTLYRIRRASPPVLPVTYLRCAQPDVVDRAELTFRNHGPYDSITIERDGSVIATLPGDATAFTDLNAAPGRHEFAVIATTGGIDAAPRRCTVRVGLGARLATTFIDPAFSPYQIARDPTDGSFVISSNSGMLADVLFRFDAALNFLGTIPAPEVAPWLVATMAIRPAPGGSELWSITWEVPAPFQQPQVFHLTKQTLDGTILSGPTPIDIPGSLPGVAVTYPTGMVHDPDSDTFIFLERNTDQFLRMDLTGAVTPEFPHPAPPFQQFVFNLGCAIDAERDVLIATSAGPFDTEVTKALEISRDGTPNGTEVPLTDTGLNPQYGITNEGDTWLVMGSAGSIPMLVRVKSADPVAAPIALDCTESQPNEVTLVWTAGEPYDGVEVHRDGITIATLPGAQASFVDANQPDGGVTYSVSGITTDGTSARTTCALVVAGNTASFLRGDASDDGSVDIGDPITILEYLFAGGDDLACFDAGDANDDGQLNVADPISLLEYLFAGGSPPPAPFPLVGPDPTQDPLGC